MDCTPKQNVDTFTMRRQLYWARTYGGPGPSAYRLPTTVGHEGHDPCKYRSPSYSFGRGAAAGCKRVSNEPRGRIYSPGPATCHGLPSSPSWSFGGHPAGLPRRTRVVVSGTNRTASLSSAPAKQTSVSTVRTVH